MTESTIQHHTETGAPQILIPKKNVVIDATIMNMVLGCQRYVDFKLNHNLVSVKGKSNSLEVGTMVHKVLEVYNKHLLKGFDRTLAINNGLIAGELYANGCPHCADFIPEINYCKVCEGTGYHKEDGALLVLPCQNCMGRGNWQNKPQCGHTPQEYPGLKNTPQESSGYIVGWKRALETCIEYFEFFKNDHWIILEAEIVKGEVLYEDDNIRILWKAKFDAIYDTNQGIFPVDYKTQKQRKDKIKLNNQFIGQCLLMKTRKMFVQDIGFQTTLKPEEKFKRHSMDYSADLLLEWQSETLPAAAYKLIEMQENNYYPADYTKCETKFGNCQFIPVCSVDRNIREEEIRIGFIKGLEWNPTNDDGE